MSKLDTKEIKKQLAQNLLISMSEGNMIFCNTHIRYSSIKHDNEYIFPTIDFDMIIVRNIPKLYYANYLVMA